MLSFWTADAVQYADHSIFCSLLVAAAEPERSSQQLLQCFSSKGSDVESRQCRWFLLERSMNVSSKEKSLETLLSTMSDEMPFCILLLK